MAIFGHYNACFGLMYYTIINLAILLFMYIGLEKMFFVVVVVFVVFCCCCFFFFFVLCLFVCLLLLLFFVCLFVFCCFCFCFFFNSKVLIIFLFLHKNICTNEYPQHMFSRRNKKTIYLTSTLSQTYASICI